MKLGYCLVAVCAGTYLHGMSLGLAYAAGGLFLDWSETFDSDKALTAWVISLNIGFCFLIGPVAGVLVSRYGARKTAMFASLLASCGLASSAFSTHLYFLYATYGILSGSGFGMMLIAGLSGVGQYFSKWLSLALGVISFGSGVCSIIIPHVIQWAIDLYSWRGAHILLASLVLQAVVMGALLRPANSPGTAQDDSPKAATVTEGSSFGRWTVVFLCRNDKRLVVFFVANIILSLGGNSLYALIVDYAVDVGMDRTYGPQLVSFLGLGSLLGRTLLLPLLALKLLNGKTMHLFIVGGALRCLGSMLVPLASSVTPLSFICIISGVGLGIQSSLGPPALAELFGVPNLPHYFGIFYSALGLGALFGPPLTGLIYYSVNSYTVSLYITGGLCFCAVIIHSIVLLMPRLNTDASSDTTKPVDDKYPSTGVESVEHKV